MKKVWNKILFYFCLFLVIATEKTVLSGLFGDEGEEGAEDVGNLYGKDRIPQRKDDNEAGDGSGKKENEVADKIPKDEKTKEQILEEEKKLQEQSRKQKEQKAGKDKDDKPDEEVEEKVIKVDEVEYDYNKVFEETKEYFDDINFDKLSDAKKEKYIKQYVETEKFEENKEKLQVQKQKEEKTGKEKDEKGKDDDKKDIKNPVRIGGVVFSYDEIYEKAVEYFEDINFDKLSDEKKAKYVKDYISSAHFKEAEKSFHKKFQDLKDKRDDVEKLEAEVKEKMAKASDNLKNSQSVLEGIEKKKADLQKIIDKKLNDILDDEEKEDARIDKKLAKEKLENLEKLEAKERKNYDNIIIQSWIDEIQSIPGLQTSRHPYDIINASKSTAARKSLKKEEIKISEGIKKIINDYNEYLTENPDAEIGIKEYFEDRDYKYPELESALSDFKKDNESGKEELPDLSKLKANEMMNRLLEKHKNYKPIPSSGKQSSIEKKGEGDEEDPNLKDTLGYGTGGSAGRYHVKSEE